MSLIQKLLHCLSGQIIGCQIHQHQMIVRSAGHDLDLTVHQSLCQRLGIVSHPLHILFELRLQRLREAHSLRCDHMHQRTALNPREHRLVEVVLFICRGSGHNHAAPRSPKGLVGGSCHNVRVGHRTLMQSGCHQSGDMSHIHHQHCPAGVSDLTEFLEIDGSRIGAGPCDDHLWLALHGDLHHVVVVDEALIVYPVGHNVKISSGKVYGASMGQMSAVIQVHTHNRVSGLQHRELNRHVGLSAGMGLHVDVLASEKFPGPLSGQIFRLVHALASAVIALAGISLRVLVGQNAPHGGHNRRTYPVFGSDQFDVAGLPLILLADDVRDLRICLPDILQCVHNFLLCPFSL